MFTVHIYIYMFYTKYMCCMWNPCHIYIYTTSKAGFQIYAVNKMHMYINETCWLPEPTTLASKYILSATFWTFYERALAENTFPPLPSQLLHNFPLPRFKLSVCTSSRETKISGIVIFSTFCIIFVFWFCCSGFLYSNELLVGKTILWLLW